MKSKYSDKKYDLANPNALSFNDRVLSVGDEVVSIFGRKLRNSVIEAVHGGGGVNCTISLVGLKATVRGYQVIKL